MNAYETAAALGIPRERFERGCPDPNPWVTLEGVLALGRDCQTCRWADRGVPLVTSCIVGCNPTSDGRGSAYMEKTA